MKARTCPYCGHQKQSWQHFRTSFLSFSYDKKCSSCQKTYIIDRERRLWFSSGGIALVIFSNDIRAILGNLLPVDIVPVLFLVFFIMVFHVDRFLPKDS